MRWMALLSLVGVARALSSAVRVARPKALRSAPPGVFDVGSLDRQQLETFVVDDLKQPKFRAKQLREWIYDKGIDDFGNMTNLPAKWRDDMSQRGLTVGGTIACIQEEQVSQKDGTIKRAYELRDGSVIESVLMPYKDGRRTACISSQAGCGMGCTFCATGQMGFTRHLTSAEIFEQASRFSRELKRRGERLSNVVFMGMGEPLANYDSVLTAARRINDELGVGARHITISTVGLARGIEKLADDPLQVTLAVSLHQADDEARSAIMPVNRRYDLEALLASINAYQKKTKRRVTFEWAAIAGENDDANAARKLGRLLKRHAVKDAHVNVIPLNPTAGFTGKKSTNGNVDSFCRTLEDEFGISATPRVRRGIDIDAGCGQLTTALEGARPPAAAPGSEIAGEIYEGGIASGVAAASPPKLTIAELKAELNHRGVKFGARDRKPALRAMLESNSV